jgi:hypothetical protein
VSSRARGMLESPGAQVLLVAIAVDLALNFRCSGKNDNR